MIFYFVDLFGNFFYKDKVFGLDITLLYAVFIYMGKIQQIGRASCRERV